MSKLKINRNLFVEVPRGLSYSAKWMVKEAVRQAIENGTFPKINVTAEIIAKATILRDVAKADQDARMEARAQRAKKKEGRNK